MAKKIKKIGPVPPSSYRQKYCTHCGLELISAGTYEGRYDGYTGKRDVIEVRRCPNKGGKWYEQINPFYIDWHDEVQIHNGEVEFTIL